ncbi:hypothetical protein JMJ35_008327 [Cladonia borealis]|uniref:Uncharacterized protein n=1 Tax=Cladonia borealis TaxID=184061 RepID=A0AA39QW57_9LECA|nr:hypothetical protein JMJ35_008327 [Cladonia borealis]
MADDENDGPTHVLDLPQLHRKPPVSSLLSTLSHLALSPSSWDLNSNADSSSNQSRSIDPNDIASYLTSIISSPLNWIDDEAAKENIWETASKRLSERSGRSAMPSLSRTFKIPLPLPDSTIGTEDNGRELHIKIYEPSLTGDNLGHKTWIASYLLAKRLALLLPSHFPSIEISEPRHRQHDSGGSGDECLKILELGAGTGLVGLAASGLFTADIYLTDLPYILPNLQYNIEQNASLVKSTGSTITAGVLDWSKITAVQGEEEKYDVILAADSLYAPEHSAWVVRTVGKYLRKGDESRIFVELPLRPGSLYPSDFRRGMDAAGFELLEEGEAIGYDDWENSSREGIEVTCWYSVWAWA